MKSRPVLQLACVVPCIVLLMSAVTTAKKPDNTANGPKAVHLDIASEMYTVLDGVIAEGVRNLHQIVGSRVEDQAAFWSSPTATAVDLPPLPGDIWCSATAINDAGIVVGWSNPGSWTGYNGKAVVWKVTFDGLGPFAYGKQNQQHRNHCQSRPAGCRPSRVYRDPDRVISFGDPDVRFRWAGRPIGLRAKQWQRFGREPEKRNSRTAGHPKLATM